MIMISHLLIDLARVKLLYGDLPVRIYFDDVSDHLDYLGGADILKIDVNVDHVAIYISNLMDVARPKI